MTSGHTVRRTTARRRPAITALLVSVLAAAGTAAAEDEGPNLVVNGNFDGSLAGWIEESHSNFTSNWSDDANFGPGPNGVLLGEGKTPDTPISHPVAWQCITVEPGHQYWFRAAMTNAAEDEEENKGGGVSLSVATATGCDRDPAFSGLAYFDHYVQLGTEWRAHEQLLTVPAGVTRVRVAAIVDNGGSYGGSIVIDDSNFMWFDGFALHEVLADLRPEFDASNRDAAAPLDEFDLLVHLRNESQYTAHPDDVTVNHQGALDLLDWECPGAVVNSQQGGSGGFFNWFDLPAMPGYGSYTCTLRVRVRAGVSGPVGLVAASHGSNEGNHGNTFDYHTIDVVPVPDVAVGVEATEFPQAGQTVQAQLTMTNNGTAPAGSAAFLFQWTDSSTGQPVTLQGFSSTCAEFLYPADTAQAGISLAVGQTRNCTLSFTWPANQANDLTGTLRAINVTGDPDTSDNVASDEAQLLRLRVNAWQDATDWNPGDGVCEIIQNQPMPYCTLRAAVMEANAIPGIQTIEVPILGEPMRLTRGTADGANAGAITVTQGVRIVGEPVAGVPPQLLLQFPGTEAHRAFNITGGGYVRIEHLEIVGQDRQVIGNGGLVQKTSSGDLDLRDVVLRNGRVFGHGGAVHAIADLDLLRTRIYDSQASSGGGAVSLAAPAIAFATFVDSHFSGNQAGTVGGALRLSNALASADGSTFDANHAQRGGAVHLVGTSLLLASNSTLSGNTADLEGGGIWAGDGTGVGLRSATIADNVAAPGDDDAGFGGGLYLEGSATATARGSVFVGNRAQVRDSGGPFGYPHSAVCWGVLDSDGYNSFQTSGTDLLCSITPTTGDHAGTFASLGPLQDNGGPTPTRALASNGNEVDLGEPACTTNGGDPLLVDQRGQLRPADGDGDGVARCDKGAYERSDAARVTVTLAGAGQGMVNSAPSGIFCGSTCSVAFEQGTQVSLAANPSPGNRFAGWSGACSGTGACVVDADGHVQVEAVFEPSVTGSLVLRLLGGGAGSVQSTPAGIACPGDCDHVFTAGEMVTLTAAPAAGSLFTGWSGGWCSGTGECHVEMSGARQVEATFALVSHQLSVGLGGDGSGTVADATGAIACPNDCGGDFPGGASVELTATPAGGSQFLRWQGGTCDGSTSPACTLSMDADASVVALFASEADPVLTVEVSGTGMVTSQPAGIACSGLCDATFTRGSNVTLTATAGAGQVFGSWRTGPCAGDTTPTCALQMDVGRQVQAQFLATGGDALFSDGFED